MSEVTNNFYIKGNYIAEQHIETQNITYTTGTGEHVASIYPRPGDNKAVVEWLEKKKLKGEDFFATAGYNRTEMCRKLSKIFGWEVDESGIRKAQEAYDRRKKA